MAQIKLDSIQLENFCYEHMFENKKDIYTIPDLPATTLKKGCYSHMFAGCSNINHPDMLIYKSTDGNIIDFATTGPWGASSVVSNVYDNGYGKVSFDIPPTYINNTFTNASDAKARLLYVEFPNSVLNMQDSMCWDCSQLQEVVTGDGVKVLPWNGSSAGTFCNLPNLKKVTIGAAVEEIESNCFIGDTALEEVIFKTPTAPTLNIHGYAFSGCSSLHYIDFPNNLIKVGVDGNGSKETFSFSGLKKLILPDSVKQIGFIITYQCSQLEEIDTGNGLEVLPFVDNDWPEFRDLPALKKVTLGSSIRDIQKGCFRNDTALVDMYYNSTMADWALVNKGYNWKGGVPATVIHCTDGDAPI